MGFNFISASRHYVARLPPSRWAIILAAPRRERQKTCSSSVTKGQIPALILSADDEESSGAMLMYAYPN